MLYIYIPDFLILISTVGTLDAMICLFFFLISVPHLDSNALVDVVKYFLICSDFYISDEINIQVEKGQAHLEREYPCMAAVNRAASLIDRHDARLIWLTYKPEGSGV